ncbi:MAG: PEGA domain-containing protein [Candidatus Nealsonbacteria bacterium]|nr:PEGA domain-containing protein [Candidatus Nealsonbacteria bacterium]
MQKRTRTILFVACLLLFFLAAPSAILYSQGYRFDFDQKRITQTGAFYAKVSPRGAKIYLNNKLRGATSFIDSSLLVENLLPGKYEIEIRKDGYHSWQKTLIVREREVSEAKHVTLFPQNINAEFIASDQEEIKTILAGTQLNNNAQVEIPETLIDFDFSGFEISPDKKRALYFTEHEVIVLFLETQYDLGQSQGNKIFLTRFSEKIGKAVWLNNYYILFNVGNGLKITEIDNRDRLNMIDLFEYKNPEIYWDRNAKNLYLLSEGNLYKASSLLP